MTEQNRARTTLHRQLLSVPHRQYAEPVVAFHEAFETDPDFVARMCVYLCAGNTSIRDQEDIAIITLLQSPNDFPEYREAGRAILLGSSFYDIDHQHNFSGLPPYRIFRILDFINHPPEDVPAPLRRKIPRVLKRIAHDYLKTLEKDTDWWDAVVIQNRQAVRSAYITYHVAPSERARLILHEDAPPEGSMFDALKKIAASSDPSEQASLIIENRIPYRIAMTLTGKTPQVGVALINNMSPVEAMNARRAVEQSGLLSIPEVREVYERKIASAPVSVASAEHRKSAQGADARISQAIAQAKQKSVEQGKRIESDTLLMIDRSGSMEDAIETAKQLGVRIAPSVDGELAVSTFNNAGLIMDIEERDSLQGWNHAFRAIRANGGTNVQAGFEIALRAGFTPQAIVIVTDGGENHIGEFAKSLNHYTEQNSVVPRVVVLGISRGSDYRKMPLFIESIQEYAHIDPDVFEYDGSDYYVLDQVVQLLGGPPARTLVDKIMEVEIPRIRNTVTHVKSKK